MVRFVWLRPSRNILRDLPDDISFLVSRYLTHMPTFKPVFSQNVWIDTKENIEDGEIVVELEKVISGFRNEEGKETSIDHFSTHFDWETIEMEIEALFPTHHARYNFCDCAYCERHRRMKDKLEWYNTNDAPLVPPQNTAVPSENNTPKNAKNLLSGKKKGRMERRRDQRYIGK